MPNGKAHTAIQISVQKMASLRSPAITLGTGEPGGCLFIATIIQMVKLTSMPAVAPHTAA